MTVVIPLDPAVVEALSQRFDHVEVLADHSWGDTSTKVFELEADGEHCIVKTFGLENHHFEREVMAHRDFLAPLREHRVVPDLVHVDEKARLLVTPYGD